MFAWNDIRHFLAVAETGSTLAAGLKLRVSQTTVARRVAALEEALGLVLFDRRQAGYALTAAGRALLPQAQAIAAAAAGFADAGAAHQREQGGTVLLTVGEILATTVLPAMLHDLHTAHPELRIELVTTDAKLDLDKGAADIAIRMAKQMTGTGVVGQRIGADLWAIYCSRGYAAEHGRPARRAELTGHAFIGGGGPGVWGIYGAWLRDSGLADAVTMHHNSSTGLLAAVRAGSGLAVLPCLVADQDAELIRCLPPHRPEPRSIWLLTHERLRHTPRVRTVVDFLAERLRALAAE